MTNVPLKVAVVFCLHPIRIQHLILDFGCLLIWLVDVDSEPGLVELSDDLEVLVGILLDMIFVWGSKDPKTLYNHVVGVKVNKEITDSFGLLEDGFDVGQGSLVTLNGHNYEGIAIDVLDKLVIWVDTGFDASLDFLEKVVGQLLVNLVWVLVQFVRLTGFVLVQFAAVYEELLDLLIQRLVQILLQKPNFVLLSGLLLGFEPASVDPVSLTTHHHHSAITAVRPTIIKLRVSTFLLVLILRIIAAKSSSGLLFSSVQELVKARATILNMSLLPTVLALPIALLSPVEALSVLAALATVIFALTVRAGPVPVSVYLLDWLDTHVLLFLLSLKFLVDPKSELSVEYSQLFFLFLGFIRGLFLLV
jgi:hypothetical protein